MAVMNEQALACRSCAGAIPRIRTRAVASTAQLLARVMGKRIAGTRIGGLVVEIAGVASAIVAESVVARFCAHEGHARRPPVVMLGDAWRTGTRPDLPRASKQSRSPSVRSRWRRAIAVR